MPLAQELAEIAGRPDSKALGAWVIDSTPTSPTGGIGLAAPISAAMALNLHSRIASRVLLQMAQAPYRQEEDLYKLASGLAWEDWFSSQQTLRVDVTAHRSPLKSLNFATLKSIASLQRRRMRNWTSSSKAPREVARACSLPNFGLR